MIYTQTLLVRHVKTLMNVCRHHCTVLMLLTVRHCNPVQRAIILKVPMIAFVRTDGQIQTMNRYRMAALMMLTSVLMQIFVKIVVMD